HSAHPLFPTPRSSDLLHPFLSNNSDQPGSTIVIPAIKQFIHSQSSLEPEVILFYARSSLLSEEAFDLLRRRWSCPLLGMNLDDKDRKSTRLNSSHQII